MKTRAAKFAAAIIASNFLAANALAAPEAAEPAPAVDQCLTTPREYTPPGTRWRYRVERGTGRHCWFLKDDVDKVAGKAAEQSAAVAEDGAPAAPRRKSATTRSVSDARAELSPASVESGSRLNSTPGVQAPANPAVAGGSQPPSARISNVQTAAVTRWPDSTSTAPVISAANPASPSPEQSAEVRPAPPPAKAQIMPRVVPPAPLTEKPMSWPMLITIIAGGFSVLAVLVSMFLAWLASRRTQRTPGAAMSPEVLHQPKRPGDLYRARKQLRAQRSGRRAA